MILGIVFICSVLGLGVVYWLFMSSYSQVLGSFPYRAVTVKKQIALTFDDGPNEPYTSQLLEYLNNQRIKATFFQVGACVAKYPEVTKRIDQAGHLIGNHSLSHQFSKYFTQPNYEQELQKSQAIFKQTLGKTPACFRPPWLWRYPRLFKALKSHHLHIVSGEFCHVFEVLQPSAERIARRAIVKAKPGAIIIFHDGHDAQGGYRQQTVDAVKLVVEELNRQNYEFVTIDKLLGLPAYNID